MSDAITHLLVPLVITRIITLFYEIDKKLILFVSTFAILPDIDFFVFWHRATFHNLLFGAFLVILAILLFKKYNSKIKIAIFGSFFFLSHVVLDKFTIAWFYPFQQYHYNLFSGKVISLQAMNAAKPNFSLEYELLMITVVLIVYLILIFEAYFYRKNVKEIKS